MIVTRDQYPASADGIVSLGDHAVSPEKTTGISSGTRQRAGAGIIESTKNAQAPGACRTIQGRYSCPCTANIPNAAANYALRLYKNMLFSDKVNKN